MRAAVVATAVVSLMGCSAAHAAVTYLTQERSISVFTSFDGASQTVSASDFAPFIDSIALATTFPTSGGGEAPNEASAGIDCHLDPNRLRLFGTLAGAGGQSVLPGDIVTTEFGRADVVTNVAFQIDAPTTVSLLALPRPSDNPEDKFKIKLQSLSGGDVIFLLDEQSPPQDVNASFLLPAGQYKIEYEAELTVVGDATIKDFGFDLLVPAPASVAPALLLGALGLRRRR